MGRENAGLSKLEHSQQLGMAVESRCQTVASHEEIRRSAAIVNAVGQDRKSQTMTEGLGTQVDGVDGHGASANREGDMKRLRRRRGRRFFLLWLFCGW